MRLVDDDDVMLRQDVHVCDGVDSQKGVVGHDNVDIGSPAPRQFREAVFAVGAARRAQALGGGH